MEQHASIREDMRQKRLLDEARKQGKIAALIDEDGHEINPHMPQYISNVPFYINPNQIPSLKHQRMRKEQQNSLQNINIEQYYKRGLQTKTSNKFKEGGCENCGANSHKTKECFERPRKIKAKFTNEDIAPDEIFKEIQHDFESKRDRWAGYDPNTYSEVIQEYESYDKERIQKQQKIIENEQNILADECVREDLAPIPNFDPKTKTTIRNLRIREDTAKYLLNLDVNSAYYDPKSRSMRDNPLPLVSNEFQEFKGDNVHLNTGDTQLLYSQERFVWETVEKKNTELNTTALPTGTEKIYKQIKDNQQKRNNTLNDQLMKAYGGEQYLQTDYSVLLAQTEKYQEYTLDGRIKKEQNKVKSKYQEDILKGNHTCIWGSWWNEELGWGYGCCHITEKQNFYCLGDRGKKIALIKEFKIKKSKEEQIKQFQKDQILDQCDDQLEQNIEQQKSISNQNSDREDKNESSSDSDSDSSESINKKVKTE